MGSRGTIHPQTARAGAVETAGAEAIATASHALRNHPRSLSTGTTVVAAGATGFAARTTAGTAIAMMASLGAGLAAATAPESTVAASALGATASDTAGQQCGGQGHLEDRVHRRESFPAFEGVIDRRPASIGQQSLGNLTSRGPVVPRAWKSICSHQSHVQVSAADRPKLWLNPGESVSDPRELPAGAGIASAPRIGLAASCGSATRSRRTPQSAQRFAGPDPCNAGADPPRPAPPGRRAD